MKPQHALTFCIDYNDRINIIFIRETLLEKGQVINEKVIVLPLLRQLLEFYCYDFSEYLETDVNEHGKFEYQYLDSYWIESGRHPYFIKVEGKYAANMVMTLHPGQWEISQVLVNAMIPNL